MQKLGDGPMMIVYTNAHLKVKLYTGRKWKTTCAGPIMFLQRQVAFINEACGPLSLILKSNYTCMSEIKCDNYRKITVINVM